MSEIRYVCISDLHLGEEDGLFTNLHGGKDEVDPSRPSPCLTQFINCLSRILTGGDSGGRKPTLVMNGDVLELALSETHQAGMVFHRFMELVMPAQGERLFDEIFLLPGNHDHHLWEMTRETQYSDFLGRRATVTDLPKPWHTTKIFCEGQQNPAKAHFLNKLIEINPAIANVEIQVAYPNLGVLSSDKSKCVVFHHGHFTEWLYWLISEGKRYFFPKTKLPEHVWDLEAENFAWIDFFWSALGRSGEAGAGVETIYEKISYPEGFKLLVKQIAASLADKFGPHWTDRFEEKAIEEFAEYVYEKVEGTEKQRVDEDLSTDSLKRLFLYMEGPLRNQIAYGLKCIDLGVDVLPQEVPIEEQIADVEIPETTFIFGHTHKPYCDYERVDGYGGGWVDIYNSGGWIVDTFDPEPRHGGSVVLVDKDLNTVAIRFYNEVKEGGPIPSVFVEEAPRRFRQPNPLFAQVVQLVGAASSQCDTFAQETEKAVSIRRKHLKKRILSR